MTPALLADPVTYASGVPYAELARRRLDAPVAWVEEPELCYSTPSGRQTRKGTGYWAITRHADITAASRRTDVFSSRERGVFLSDPRTPADLERVRQLLINMDGREHLRIRKYVGNSFNTRAVRQLAESVRQHAEALVHKAVLAEEFDGVGDLAAELPLLVLTDLLGIPRADRHLLLRWSNNLVGFDDPEYGGGDLSTYRDAFREALSYAYTIAVQRRRQPTDDLVGRILATEVDGARIDEASFAQFWLLLVIAGNETTRHLLSGSLQALLEFPEERRRLCTDPDLTNAAVDELIRWVTPIMQFRRTVTTDTELGGQPLSVGDKAVLYFISGNRDERVFTAPDRLRLDRSPNGHIAFGIGPHYCLGWRLARLEAATLLDSMRRCLPRLQPNGPAVRLASNFVNGLKALPLRVATRA